MVQVNISGRGPGGGSRGIGGGGNGSGGGGVVPVRVVNVSDFNMRAAASASAAARASSSAASGGAAAANKSLGPDSDGGAGWKARDAAQRQTDKKRREEERMWAQRDAETRRAKTELNRKTRDEIRERDKEATTEIRTSKDRQRRAEKDARDQKRLDDQKVRIERQRGLDNWRIHMQRQNLEHRADWHLTPSSYRAFERSMMKYDNTRSVFTKNYGMAPDARGSGDLRRGMGSLEGTYRVQNAMRLGGIGQRASEERDYRTLVRIEREMKRLDNISSRRLRFSTDPVEQANLAREKNAILHGGRRIAAAEEGTPWAIRKAGRAWGRVSNAFHDPIARGAMDAFMATAMWPVAGHRIVSGLIGLQQPYMNFQLMQHTLARGAGGMSTAASRRILDYGMGPLLNPLNSGLTPFDRRFGFNAPFIAKEVLGQYAIPLRKTSHEGNVAASIRMASLAGGMQMPEHQIAQMLGGATDTGLVNRGNAGRNEYFRQLQKTTAVAVREGLNESRLANSWQSFLQTQVSSGSGFSFKGLSSWYRSLLGAGSAGRSGALQSTLAQGVMSASQGMGGNSPATVAASMFLHNNPGAMTATGLQKALHISSAQWDAMVKSNPQALKDYLAAGNNKWARIKYLGALIGGSPTAFHNMYRYSGLGGLVGPGLNDIVYSAVSNSPLTAVQQMHRARVGAGSAAMMSMGLAPYVSPQAASLISPSALGYGGMPKYMKMGYQAAFEAVAQTESSGRVHIHGGMFQVTQPALDAYNRHSGTHYTLGQLQNNPSLEAKVGAWYYEKSLGMAGGNFTTAYGLYNMGATRHNLNLINSGQESPQARANMMRFNGYLQQDASGQASLYYLRRQAMQDQGTLEGSRGAFKEWSAAAAGIDKLERGIQSLANDVQAIFHGAVVGVTDFTNALSKATGMLNHVFGGGHSMPGYGSTNPYRIPNYHNGINK